MCEELKAIYHNEDTVSFYIFKTRDLRNEFVEKAHREEIYKQYLIINYFLSFYNNCLPGRYLKNN